MKSSQSGNVLFYILIAVALLAALSYVVAHSSRGGVGTLSAERAAVYATDIMSFGNTVSQAVSQIRLRGYDEDEISFENTVVSGYVNGNCTDVECEIFNIAGAGVVWTSPPGGANDGTEWIVTDDMEVEDVGRTCGASNCTELTLQLLGVKDEVCQKINDKLGITAPETIPSQTDVSSSKFQGIYSYADTIADQAGSAKLAGLNAGCFYSSNDDYNVYYQVLIAR